MRAVVCVGVLCVRFRVGLFKDARVLVGIACVAVLCLTFAVAVTLRGAFVRYVELRLQGVRSLCCRVHLLVRTPMCYVGLRVCIY